jgi:hypothetical protein
MGYLGDLEAGEFDATAYPFTGDALSSHSPYDSDIPRRAEAEGRVNVSGGVGGLGGSVGRLLDAHGPHCIALTGGLLTAAGITLLLAERPESSD